MTVTSAVLVLAGRTAKAGFVRPFSLPGRELPRLAYVNRVPSRTQPMKRVRASHCKLGRARLSAMRPVIFRPGD